MILTKTADSPRDPHLTPLWRIFFDALASQGISCLCIPRHFKCRGELAQCVAVGVAIGKYRVCKSPCRGSPLGARIGVELLRAVGGAECPWSLAKQCAEPIDVAVPLPEAPRIVIDLSLWHEHTPGEKHELVEQILATLGVVRGVLWDGNLWVTHAPADFVRLLELHARGMVHRMRIVEDMPPLQSPVVLDPEGPCLFTEEVARSHVEFIIGGIVDKEHVVKSGTRRLAELIGVEKRCRIELRGSTVGVPDRINKIAEIVLRALAGQSLEEAILATQAKRDRVYRLMWEIQKRGQRGPDGTIEISPDALREANWLGASAEEVELALKKARAKVARG